MLSTRNLILSDCKAVLQINAASVPGVSALDELEFGRLMTMPNHHFAIEDANHLMLGYALAFHSNAQYDGQEFQSFQQKALKPFIYIDQVAVQIESRRMGIASAIYDALESVARKNNIFTLCCEVNIDPANPKSMAFHRSRGFSHLEVMATDDGRVVALLTKNVFQKVS